MSVLGSTAANTDLQSSNAVWPAGVIAWWPGTAASVPSGWKVCDGTAASTTPLQNIVGSNVPNFTGRALAGVDTTYLSLLGTRGSIEHSHNTTGLTGDTHTHSAGSLYVEDHTHSHSLSVGGHTHGLSTQTANALGSGQTVDYLAATDTGSGAGGIGGSINNADRSLGVSGNSRSTSPGFNGTTAVASPALQVGHWIVKT